jgi:MFS transporter, DHA2 family, triacylglyceride efflux pump
LGFWQKDRHSTPTGFNETLMQLASRLPKNSVIIALVSLPIFIGALDLTVVSAVLPHVIYDLEIPLQTGLDEAAWLVSGYLLAYTVAMTFMGRLSDLHGRRRIFLLALGFFALGSYLVAVGEGWPTQLGLRAHYLFLGGRPDSAHVSLLVLIAARMIQAFGGGAMVPVGMALASDLYPAVQRAKVIGVVAAVDTAGWVVGHLYGGIVARYFDWHTIFWLNLPACLLAFVLIALVLRGLPQPHGVGKMDWLGAMLISLGLAALNLGLGSNSGIGDTFQFEPRTDWLRSAAPFLVATAILIGLFIWRQAHAAAVQSGALVPLHLFKLPNFSFAGLANLLVGIGLFIAIANVPLFINTLVAPTLEQGTWDSGWMLSALTVPMAIASIPGGWLTVRFGYRVPAALGLVGAIVGFALMSRWQASTPYGVMIPHLVLAGVGFGLTIAPIAAAAINAAPESYRGTASALVIIFRLIGMTVGVSSMATYGIQRANYLSARLLTSTDLAEVARVGMTVAETVIHETFWIAASVCVLALIPILALKFSPEMFPTERSSK